LPQHLGHRGPSEHFREHQRRHPVAIVRIDCRAMLQQQLRDFGKTLEGHTAEGRLAAPVAAIHLGALRQEHARRLKVIVITREHQQGVALVILEIHRQARAHHRFENVRFTRPGHVQRLALQLGVTAFLRLGDRGRAAHHAPTGSSLGSRSPCPTPSKAGCFASARFTPSA